MEADDIYGDDLLSNDIIKIENTGHVVDAAPQAPQLAASDQDQPENDISHFTPDQLRTELLQWEEAFAEERQEGGIFAGIIGRIQPLSVINELRRARSEATHLRQRLAAAAAEAAARVQEDILLRKELWKSRAASDPSILQLRQLLLEPAVNREFQKLSSAMATAAMEATALKNEMRAVHEAANNPTGPRALAAKLQSLQERYDALEKAGSEDNVVALQRSLETAKAQLEEMRAQYGQLEDHTHSLEDEIDVLQRHLAGAERRAEEAMRHSGGGGGTNVLPVSGHHHHPHPQHPPQPLPPPMYRGSGGPPPARPQYLPPPMPYGRGGGPLPPRPQLQQQQQQQQQPYFHPQNKRPRDKY